MKRIAIVGAGLAGLAIAWYLSNSQSPRNPLEITLYDAHGIGAGASGIAAGLLHPYAGRWASLNWRAREGMQATLQLIGIAQEALRRKLVETSGMLRLPIDTKQQRAFCHCAANHTDTSLWHPDRVREFLPFFSGDGQALYISSAYTCHCLDYLQGLWLACQQRGVTFEQRTIDSLESIPCDIAVAATGATLLPEYRHLPIRALKGQILELSWPKKLSPLPFPISSSTYLLMDTTSQRCIVGATFEKQFDHPYADDKGPMLLLPSTYRLCPPLTEALILASRAGLRATAPNHLPLYLRLNNTQWIGTGLGSKGLLYHALMGAEIARDIIASF